MRICSGHIIMARTQFRQPPASNDFLYRDSVAEGNWVPRSAL